MKRAGRIAAARHQIRHAGPVLHTTHPVPVHLGREGQYCTPHTRYSMQGQYCTPHTQSLCTWGGRASTAHRTPSPCAPGEGGPVLHTTHPVPVHLGREGQLAEPHHTPSPCAPGEGGPVLHTTHPVPVHLGREGQYCTPHTQSLCTWGGKAG